ncbi:TetR/AcrR family transcriptional regulator [Parasphingopyxis sp.]|uniref:TetR/AcrR family transcriptional regulator n=1 Tax=Parasphingopyxis sp. TaxID=1920299 RepID=UPI00261FE9D8|nr:TetR/AcrR family transcriptional regulator [Parasphingopyxis sp.]
MADTLIRQNGYGQTTIEEIATSADVSVGTLYSYFGSKGGVLGALMLPIVDQMERRAAKIIDNPPERGVDAMAAIFEAYRFNDDWKSLNILAAFAHDSADRGDAALEDIRKAFERVKKRQLRELLDRLVDQGKFPPTLDLDDVVALLYMLLISHFEDYLAARGAMPYEEMMVNMQRRLRVMFEYWET